MILHNTYRWLDKNRGRIRTAVGMAWPSVLESFFVALAGMVDTMMVSSIGAYAVAAVGLTTQPKFIGLALFIATNVSVSALVARRKGEMDAYGANETLLTALVFTAIAGTVVSAVCVYLADPIIRLCGSGADTHEGAVLYFRIIMGGMMFNIISLVINAAQRGSGNTRIAMTTNVTSNLLNIVGNYLLIGGHFGFPALGIKGAAIATVFGPVVACVMSIASLLRKDSFVNIRTMVRDKVRLSLRPVKAIAKLSSSVFLEQLLMRAGFMSTAVMTARLGTEAFAAHQAAMNILSISFSFGDGMQVAAVALIGRSLGEKRPQLARLYGQICQRIGNVISLAVSVFFLLGGRFLYQIYFDESHIVDMGVTLVRVIVLIVIVQIAQVIYMGCLRGAGDVIFTTIASTVSVTIIRTAVSYGMCYVAGLGLVGIWLGILADQISRFLFTSWRFKSGKWTKIRI